MGISRDHWHKRRKTGGKRKPYHKKRKYELGRPPANTKIGPRRIHTVRVRGGNKKYRALRLDSGNFDYGALSKQSKSRKPALQRAAVSTGVKKIMKLYESSSKVDSKEKKRKPNSGKCSNKIKKPKGSATNEGPKQLCLSKFFSTSKTTAKNQNC